MSLLSTSFQVADDGGIFRTFTFTTVDLGGSYKVTIQNDGMGPYDVPLSVTAPTAQIPDHGARVQAVGTLCLAFDNPTFGNIQVLFSGVLQTSFPVRMQAIVATIVRPAF